MSHKTDAGLPEADGGLLITVERRHFTSYWLLTISESADDEYPFQLLGSEADLRLIRDRINEAIGED